MADSPTVVLVHGAFADASGFAGIIAELEGAGHTVFAPANPLRSLSGDAESIRRFVAAIDGPVVLVGHSYGGAVITQASASLENVTALVYLAGFALDEGDSLATVQEPFPPTLLGANIAFTSYDAAGAPGGPDACIAKDFKAAHTEPAGPPRWKNLPSWFLISAEDHAIHPDTEAFMAERDGAKTETIQASHVAFASQPKAVAEFIERALA